MRTRRFDELDKRLLTLLQEDARETAIELATALDDSDNTVHNRMNRLEDAGIISGYRATIDYGRTGLGFYFHFVCTARISQRGAVVEEVMAFREVIEVTELMTGQDNLHIKLAGSSDEDITRMAERLDDLPLEITEENLIRAEHTKPLDLVEVSGEAPDA